LLAKAFDHACSSHSEVDFASEYADMVRDTRKMPLDEYLASAMAHRFCLIAPGDFPSTHKTAESVAIGAAGGCVPVFVLDDGCHAEAAARRLPYTRWLDYCEIGYVASRSAAEHDMGGLLRWLRAVGRKEWLAKSARLQEVRDAFVFRANSTMERPSAPQVLLHELCHMTRLRGATPTAGAPRRTAAGNMRHPSDAASTAISTGVSSRGLAPCGYGCHARRP
jgi:hypothetical protein